MVIDGSARALAEQLSELLLGTEFGIGGSCLLQQLGLEVTPRDVDIICSEADYATIFQRLSTRLSAITLPAHPEYCSKHFQRFVSDKGVGVDLMAGVAVARQGRKISFSFDPSRTQMQQGIRWMLAEDWLQLYQLFNRPQRVQQLTRLLAQSKLADI
jgi:3-isopropylmalate dehydratase small subunit